MKTSALKAVLKKPGRLSFIWTIPVIAIFITAILVWQNTIRTGREITLNCIDASGIEAGKTLVKFRSVTVGKVESVKLDNDYSRVILKVRMEYGTDGILRKDSVFYLVKPRVQSTNISGLDTILSGNYISVNQGSSESFADTYDLYDTVPADISEPDTYKVTLISSGHKKLSVGDPVTFRGFNVGKVSGARLDIKTGKVIYSVGIQTQYMKLLTASTVFWINSGMDMSLGPNGISFNTDTLTSLISGGLSFDNFNSQMKGSLSSEKQILYDDRKSAEVASLMNRPLYVVMVHDASNMLASGSLVKYRGANVGKVIAFPWFENNSDLFDSLKRIPILIALSVDGVNDQDIKAFFDGKLKGGKLVASLGASTPISRGDMVNLEIVQNKTDNSGINVYRGYKVIPLVSSSNLTDDISLLVNKLGKLDYEGISGELRKDLSSLNKLLKTYDQVGSELNRNRIFERLGKVMDDLSKVESRLSGEGGVLDPQKGTAGRVNEVLNEIKNVLNEAKPGINRVSNDPSSLIFGARNNDPEPMPSESAK